jgi:hypothetical protein
MITVLLAGLKGSPPGAAVATAILGASACAYDATLTALFTPLHPRLGRYEVCTTPDALEKVAAEAEHPGPVEALDPVDAFGRAGPYEAIRLARLYRGIRPRVVRAWVDRVGRFESVTLISPYPNGSLTQLLPGTLVIRYIIAPKPHGRTRGEGGSASARGDSQASYGEIRPKPHGSMGGKGGL